MLGGVPVLITPGDMSNTIPDEKVTATFIGYLAVRLLDLSRFVVLSTSIHNHKITLNNSGKSRQQE